MAMIERRELPEGARLPAETVLAAQFGVSRPTVRETLARLRDEGLIASRRGSGSYIQPRALAQAPAAKPAFREIDSFEQIRQSYEFRRAVEGDAAFLAAQTRDEARLTELRTALRELDAAVTARVVGAAADFNFHLAVARASGNSFFESAMSALRGQIEVTIDIARKLSLTGGAGHVEAVQAEHVAVFDAVHAGDPERARTAMREHLTRTCDRIFRGPRF
jgi:DNA-binding FadR family transcriptional regulator